MTHDGDDRRPDFQILGCFAISAEEFRTRGQFDLGPLAFADDFFGDRRIHRHGLASTPKLSQTTAAVSKAICWLVFAIPPFLISSLMMFTVLISPYSASCLTDNIRRWLN